MSLPRRPIQLACIALAAGGLLAGPAWAAETNRYHFNRRFESVIFTNLDFSTVYKVMQAAREITGIVGPFPIQTNYQVAVEREGLVVGMTNPLAAWEQALSGGRFSNHVGVVYDNAGWCKGALTTNGDWGAYLWTLENQIQFYTSTSDVCFSESGATCEIARVLVGSIGDFCPQAYVEDVGPALDTNFPGMNAWTDAVFRADFDAYFKLTMPMTMQPNDNDDDGDGIPDYADGFNWDGLSVNPDDETLGDAFVP